MISPDPYIDEKGHWHIADELTITRGNSKVRYTGDSVSWCLYGRWDDIPMDYELIDHYAKGTTYTCTDTRDVYILKEGGWELLL